MLDGAPTCLRLSITSITPSLVIKYLPWLLALQANLIDLVADIKCITDISPCLPGAKAVAQMVELLKQERTKKSTRDLCILRFLYDLGLKRAEVVSIDVEDIDLERGEIWVKGKEAAKGAFQPSQAYVESAHHVAGCPGRERWWPSTETKRKWKFTYLLLDLPARFA